MRLQSDHQRRCIVQQCGCRRRKYACHAAYDQSGIKSDDNPVVPADTLHQCITQSLEFDDLFEIVKLEETE